MKKILWTSALLLVAALTGFAGAGSLPRTDVNPALLYWQAFNLFPRLTEAEAEAFLTEPPSLPQGEGERIAAQYDNAFRLIRRAVLMRVSCDWGTDLADGPRALIANVARLRHTVQAAQARAHYALEAGRPRDAAEDLVATLVLGRHSGARRTLVATMVGIGTEEAVVAFVAANFDRFSPESLRLLVQQCDAAPPRPTVRQAMETERVVFWAWLIARLEDIQAACPDDTSKGLAGVRELFRSAVGDGDRMVDDLIEDCGHTTTGLVTSLRQLGGFYDQVSKIAGSTPPALEDETAAMQERVASHPNHLPQMFIPDVGGARKSEIRAATHAVMLRAAVALRLEGQAGFQKVRDPFGTGPFTLRPVTSRSGQASFELESELGRSWTNLALSFKGSSDTAGRP